MIQFVCPRYQSVSVVGQFEIKILKRTGGPTSPGPSCLQATGSPATPPASRNNRPAELPLLASPVAKRAKDSALPRTSSRPLRFFRNLLAIENGEVLITTCGPVKEKVEGRAVHRQKLKRKCSPELSPSNTSPRNASQTTNRG